MQVHNLQHNCSPRTPAPPLPSWPGEPAEVTAAAGDKGTGQPSCHLSEELCSTVSLPSISFTFLQMGSNLKLRSL